MSSLSQFTGVRKIAAIHNYCSAGSPTPFALGAALSACKSVAPNITSGGTLVTALSLTGSSGRGALNFIGAATTNATSRTLRLKVTIDGTVVFDATSAATTTNGNGIAAIGGCSSYAATFQPVRFYTSALVEFTSSDTQNGQVNCLLNYEVDV